MSFSVSLKAINFDKIAGRFEKMGKAAEKAVEDATAEAALLVHSSAVKSIQAHLSHGAEYGNHTASLPGFPPNTDKGDLVRSIQFNVDGKTASVGTNLRYGAWLEFGTRHIAPRPWLMPAYQENIGKIIAIFSRAAKGALT